MKVLLTGGSGFLGSKLLIELNNNVEEIIAPVRSIPNLPLKYVDYPIYKDLSTLVNEFSIFSGF